MARFYMVRHGKAQAGFGEAMDPGLDDLGRTQAEAVARELAPLGPLPIFSSPLARAQQTAAPLAALWSRTPVIEEAVAEIPSPLGMTMEERVAWLRSLMGGVWSDTAPETQQWRATCIATLAALTEDCVIFSHYVVLNVAAGAALGDDRAVVFSPDNCSVTIFETDGARLTLIEKGLEAELTKVN